MGVAGCGALRYLHPACEYQPKTNTNLPTKAKLIKAGRLRVDVGSLLPAPSPKRQRAGALQDASRSPCASEPRASVLDCGDRGRGGWHRFRHWPHARSRHTSSLPNPKRCVPFTPPRRGTPSPRASTFGLPSLEGLGVGSRAQSTNVFRPWNLSPSDGVRIAPAKVRALNPRTGGAPTSSSA